MTRFIAIAAALLALGTVPQAAAAQEQKSSTLPGGASSLQETYQDWQVACVMVDKGRTCTMAQQQARKTGQRVLTYNHDRPNMGIGGITSAQKLKMAA